MCGRATLNKQPKEVEKRLQATFEPADLELVAQILPTFNMAPTHWHPVITNEVPQQLALFKWGLIPAWAKDTKIASRLINARIETITQKPAFKAIHTRRCLVPFDGFYEWKKEGKNKVPYHIALKERTIFCVAGIWETWKDATGTLVHTFSVLTQAPNELMIPIHNRMPAILTKEQEKIWLDGTLPIKEVLASIRPYPSELMEAYQVSNRVGKVTNNDATLLNRNFPRQGTLF